MTAAGERNEAVSRGGSGLGKRDDPHADRRNADEWGFELGQARVKEKDLRSNMARFEVGHSKGTAKPGTSAPLP